MNFEKVNPMHVDKIADRIAGAMVDLAYSRLENPKVAVEVLIGHRKCTIIAESSYNYTNEEVQAIVDRIADDKCELNLTVVPQDAHLANNQANELRCGDNGIFKGVPTDKSEKKLAEIAENIYNKYKTDGKYIITDDKLIICLSNATEEELREEYKDAVINPLGYWTGGINVDSGATNRKLGSDMGRAVTGGGLHGKDLSKADVSVNIFCYLLAQQYNLEFTATCAIGDKFVRFNSAPNEDGQVLRLEYCYRDIVYRAKQYIDSIGNFEKLAEWGLIR